MKFGGRVHKPQQAAGAYSTDRSHWLVWPPAAGAREELLRGPLLYGVSFVGCTYLAFRQVGGAAARAGGRPAPRGPLRSVAPDKVDPPR